jgi:hypothetical protein
MKIHAPIFMKTRELLAIMRAIEQRNFPLTADIEFYGRRKFVPVRAYNVLISGQAPNFESHFVDNFGPYLDLPVLKDCQFQYTFQASGKFEQKTEQADLASFETSYEGYKTSLLAPTNLKSGDLLLASMRYPFPSE